MEAIRMIPAIVIGLVVAGIVTAAGLKSIGSFKDTLTANTAERNATEDTIDGIGEISGQFGTIGIIAAMVIVLMMIGGLTLYFGLR